MEPPLASTIKLTRNLCGGGKRSEGVTDRSKTAQSLKCNIKVQEGAGRGGAKAAALPSMKQQLEVTTVESRQACTELILRAEVGFSGRPRAQEAGKSAEAQRRNSDIC